MPTRRNSFTLIKERRNIVACEEHSCNHVVLERRGRDAFLWLIKKPVGRMVSWDIGHARSLMMGTWEFRDAAKWTDSCIIIFLSWDHEWRNRTRSWLVFEFTFLCVFLQLRRICRPKHHQFVEFMSYSDGAIYKCLCNRKKKKKLLYMSDLMNSLLRKGCESKMMWERKES